MLNKNLFNFLIKAIGAPTSKKCLNPIFFKLVSNQQIKLASTFTSFNKQYKLNLCTKFDDAHLEFSYNNESNQKLNKDLPYIWLRNNCRCSKCYNYQVQEVELDFQRIPLNVKPSKIEQISPDVVQLTWDDGHVSQVHFFTSVKFNALNYFEIKV